MSFGIESNNASESRCIHHIFELPEGISSEILTYEMISGTETPQEKNKEQILTDQEGLSPGQAKLLPFEPQAVDHR